MRHLRGEDVNVGCVLTWGPCWYFQKQFFEGDTSRLSSGDHLMRLAKEKGQAVVLVTHNPEIAARCDRRLVMRDGRFVDEQ